MENIEPKTRREYFLNKIAEAVSGEGGGGSDGGQTQKRTLYIALYGEDGYPVTPDLPSDLPDTGDEEFVWSSEAEFDFGIFDESKTPLNYAEINNIDVYNTVFKLVAGNILDYELDHEDVTLFPVSKTYIDNTSSEISIGNPWIIVSSLCFSFDGNNIYAGVLYSVSDGK